MRKCHLSISFIGKLFAEAIEKYRNVLKQVKAVRATGAVS